MFFLKNKNVCKTKNVKKRKKRDQNKKVKNVFYIYGKQNDYCETKNKTGSTTSGFTLPRKLQFKTKVLGQSLIQT